MKPKSFLLFCLLCVFVLGSAPIQASAARTVNAPQLLAEQVIFAEALGQGWENWSWGSTINLANASPVHSGTRSLLVDYGEAWAGLQLHHAGVSTVGMTQLRFYIHGGTSGGQKMNLHLEFSDGSSGTTVTVPAPAASQWQEARFPLSSLNAVNKTVTLLVIQDTSGVNQSAFYLDDMAFIDDTDPNGPVFEPPTLHPRAVPADGATQVVLRAKVNDPQGLSDIQSVTVDASVLGRGTVALKDDGLNNDASAGDGIFGTVLTVAPGTPSQEATMVINARDAAGHSSNLLAGTLVILSTPGGTIPAALPQRFGWGSNGYNANDLEHSWQQTSGVPFNYLYMYITAGWETWGNTYVKRFVDYAWGHNFVPVITVYMVLGIDNCGEWTGCYIDKLKTTSFVNQYITSYQNMLNQAKGTKPVIIHIEPDFYGYMQQYTNTLPLPAGIRKDDPTSIAVTLNRNGYSNNLAGFGKYLVDITHAAGSNFLVAPGASAWGTNSDPNAVSPAEAIQMGQHVASFITQMGGDKADLIIVEWSDRDSGCTDTNNACKPPRAWWDDTDTNLPRPNRALLFENALSVAADKRLLLWQTPVGNMNLDNTSHHYRDNRAAYAFNHPRDLFDSGIIGLMFGGGEGTQTQVDTDGGFVGMQGSIAYASPATPTGLQAAGAPGPAVQLRWNEGVEPDLWGYKVTCQLVSGGSTTVYDARRKTNLTVLLPAGNWKIELRTYDAMGNESQVPATVNVTVTGNPKMVYLPAIRR